MPTNKPFSRVPGDQLFETTTTTATAGTGGALPATVQGYITVAIGGVDFKVPYYKV